MMIKKSENEIHIRLGNDYKYISSIMLNNGIKLVNMQCTLSEPAPTIEQLQEFEKRVEGTFRSDRRKELDYLEEQGLI